MRGEGVEPEEVAEEEIQEDHSVKADADSEEVVQEPQEEAMALTRLSQASLIRQRSKKSPPILKNRIQKANRKKQVEPIN